MNKLTAEKARERLAQLDAAAERCGLSLNEEMLEQALHLALIVLEASPVASIDERGLNAVREGSSVSAHAPEYAEHKLYLLNEVYRVD